METVYMLQESVKLGVISLSLQSQCNAVYYCQISRSQKCYSYHWLLASKSMRWASGIRDPYLCKSEVAAVGFEPTPPKRLVP